jgi:hypothetical protein
MMERFKRQLDRIEKSMVPCVPKVKIILAFVPPADGAQSGNVKYFRFHGLGKQLERVNRDGSPWEGDQRRPAKPFAAAWEKSRS